MPRYTPEYCESLLAANPQACAGMYDRIMRGKVIADVADHTTFVLKALEDGPKSAIPVAVWCRSNGDPGMEGELARRICDRLVREGKVFKDGQVYSLAAGVIVPVVDDGPNDPAEIPVAAPTTSQEAAPIRRANASTKKDVRVVARRMQPGREASIWPDILERCEKLEIGESTNVDVPAGKFRNVFAQDIRNRLNAATTKQWLWNATQAEGDFVIVTKRELNPKCCMGDARPQDKAQADIEPSAAHHSSIYDSLYAAVSHLDVKISALQADRERLIEMAQRFQEQV